MITPITPEEAKKSLLTKIEPEMIQAVNELIVENLKGRSSQFKQQEIEDKYLKIKNLHGEYGREEMRRVYEKGLMDIEGLFEKYGWNVEYNKPGYNESGNCYFTFTIKLKETFTS